MNETVVKKNWKELALKAWNEGLKSALAEFSSQTDNKWDDMAVEMVDKVVNKVLG